jgi:hypothetical protein
MSHRTAGWLAWSLWAVCVLLIGLAFLLDFVTRTVPVPPGTRASLGFTIPMAVLSLASPTVGALIASRLPTNPIGWIFCSVGLLYAAHRFTMAYADYGVGLLYAAQGFTRANADYALLENIALPLGVYAAWFSWWVWFTQPLVIVFLMLLFPDGRLVSRRWRVVAWVALCGAALAALGDAVFLEDWSNHPYVLNPFRTMALSGGGFTTYQTISAAGLLGYTLLVASTLAALFSLILRLYRTWGDERQQIKWFLFAAVPAALCLIPILLQYIVDRFTEAFLSTTVQMSSDVYQMYLSHVLMSWDVYRYLPHVSLFSLLAISVCTYIAILKYRLYDIDVVINRTLVYGSLSAILVGLYFVGVVLLQRLFVLLTGQRSTLAVVASTLLIAALFTPLRRRIQSFIDRHFYRRKYDARKTLEDFSAQLRNETDLEALSEDLVGVVRETMQPAHVSLWLRPDTPRKGQQAV